MRKLQRATEDDMHMADVPPYRTPRWVKVFGITILVVVLLVVIILVTGIGGEHGPWRHGDAGGYALPASLVEITRGPMALSDSTLPVGGEVQQRWR